MTPDWVFIHEGGTVSNINTGSVDVGMVQRVLSWSCWVLKRKKRAQDLLTSVVIEPISLPLVSHHWRASVWNLYREKTKLFIYHRQFLFFRDQILFSCKVQRQNQCLYLLFNSSFCLLFIPKRKNKLWFRHRMNSSSTKQRIVGRCAAFLRQMGDVTSGTFHRVDDS